MSPGAVLAFGCVYILCEKILRATSGLLRKFQLKKKKKKPGVVGHPFSTSTWKVETGRSLEFKSSLDYIVSSGQPGLCRDPLSQKIKIEFNKHFQVQDSFRGPNNSGTLDIS